MAEEVVEETEDTTDYNSITVAKLKALAYEAVKLRYEDETALLNVTIA